MKKIVLFFAILSITIIAMSQIKVATSGNVGIGTNITTNGKLQIASNGSEFAFHASNKTDGKAYFGSYCTNGDPWINFYHPKTHYNKVRYKQAILSSDSILKTEITLLGNITGVLKQIKTYSYYFKSDSIEIRSDSIDLRKKDYGVLAQEIITILPDLVDTAKSEMFVNYNAFIALLIKGFNEQQTLIEEQQNQLVLLQNIVADQENDILQIKILKQVVEGLQEKVKNCCEKPKGGSQIPDDSADLEDPYQSPQLLQPQLPSTQKAILYQNSPNPFSSNTEISCFLPEAAKQGVIYISNLQGTELKACPIEQAGLNTIIVHGSELPAGMYLYTLVVDNEIIDSKRMILTK
jgi:hypothetical protein